jgi:homospermidine synthase
MDEMGIKGVAISIFGSAGGVARALLSLLNKSITDSTDPLYKFIKQSTLYLIDIEQKDIVYYYEICPNLVNQIVLNQIDLADLKEVRKHISETETSLIVDLSWADTIDILDICNEFGVFYVNSALENIKVNEDKNLEGFTLLERFYRFEDAKNRFTNTKGIVCSGMNPGVVQWMAYSVMAMHPNEKPLACYIVEHDTTFYKEKSLLSKDTIYTTWSPECFLDEAILNYPMFVKGGVPLHLYKEVYAQEFKVTLGDIQFYGCLMPHEEVLSLGSLYDMETGFIYKVNDYTTQTIRDNLECVDDLLNWNLKVLDPAEAELEGEDLVGVLLVYKDKERFMYNVMNSQYTFEKFGTNATYIQVACGVYAGICTLLLDTISNGVFYVEELLEKDKSNGYGKYITQYMKEFVIGENQLSDGLIIDRMKKYCKK